MPRQHEQERDEYGRFASDADSRASRGDRSPHERYGDRTSRDWRQDDRWNERDARERFVSDDDRYGPGSQGRYGGDRDYSNGSNRWPSNDRERDDRGRFVADSERQYGSRARGFGDDGERQRYRAQGSFERSRYDADSSRDLYDNNSYGERDRDRYTRGGYESQDRWPRGRDDADFGYRQRYDHRGRGGFDEDRSRDYERGRAPLDMGRASFLGRDDDRDSRRGGRRDDEERSGREREGRGWFGDPQGHAQAAQRGWQHRR